MIKNLKNPIVQFYIFILSIITIGVIWLFINSIITINKMDDEIIKIETIHAKNFAQNIQQYIKKLSPSNLVNSIKKSKSLQNNITNALTLFSDKQYKYVYLIYLSKNKTFRYLCDGSKQINQRGELNQKFEPESKKIWKKLLKYKKPIYAKQKNISSLWITYLYPIMYKDKVSAILVFDISISEYKNLTQILRPVYSLLIIVTILLIFILLFSFFQTFAFLRQKKKTNIDALTHLFNRSYLNEIKKDINLSQCAIAMADIDHFKKINDNFGHDIGDTVLETIAKRLVSATRTYDIIIRYGGEEFLIFFKKQTDIKTLREVSSRILKTISDQPIRTERGDLQVTLSMGINPMPSMDKTLHNAIINADKMLYIAKTSGRNKVVILNENTYCNDSSILKDIDTNIKENRLKAYFQPILDIKTGKIVKYEALARITDKNDNLYLPSQFLPIIKDTSIYETLTKDMFKQAFSAIKKHGIYASVNINISDLSNNSIFTMIKELIQKNIQFADMLTIELFTDIQIREIEGFKTKINVLKCMKVKIAIDNFTDDRPNSNHLINIKPDILKIDGSIIKKLLTDENARTILKEIINTCESHNIESIAELVESKEIFDLLKKYNIKMAQGFYIGKPLKIDSRKFLPKILFFK